MDYKMLTINEVEKITGLHIDYIKLWYKSGRFPRPTSFRLKNDNKYINNKPRWDKKEILQFLNGAYYYNCKRMLSERSIRNFVGKTLYSINRSFKAGFLTKFPEKSIVVKRKYFYLESDVLKWMEINKINYAGK